MNIDPSVVVGAVVGLLTALILFFWQRYVKHNDKLQQDVSNMQFDVIKTKIETLDKTCTNLTEEVKKKQVITFCDTEHGRYDGTLTRAFAAIDEKVDCKDCTKDMKQMTEEQLERRKYNAEQFENIKRFLVGHTHGPDGKAQSRGTL